MKITVIGCGRWGSFIAWYLDRKGNDVTVYDLKDNPVMQTFQQTRTNGIVTYPPRVTLTTDLSCALSTDTDVIVISINSQGLRNLMEELAPYHLQNKIFILCMKGIEISTGKRLSEVVEEFAHPSNAIAVSIGPGHPQEFVRGIPNCMVIDSKNEDVKRRLVYAFSGDLIRFYYGNDLIGNEIGAATKNVIGIAAGLLDGLNLSTLKGALMSRGTREVARLIKAMGGSELSAYGLCHLGDYQATVFSEYSHNRRFGELFARGESYDQLAEGYYTVAAVMKLQEDYHVEMPISTAVYRILYENADLHDTLRDLFLRSIKQEFE